MPITKDPNEDYFEAYKFLLEDTCDTDERVEEYARLVLNDRWVDGDSYGVPGTLGLVCCLVAYIHALANIEPPKEEQDLQWAINQIKNNPETMLKLDCRPTTLHNPSSLQEDQEEDALAAYLRSNQFAKDFAAQVKKDTWDKGFPMIYMDKEGWLVEHWANGDIFKKQRLMSGSLDL